MDNPNPAFANAASLIRSMHPNMPIQEVYRQANIMVANDTSAVEQREIKMREDIKKKMEEENKAKAQAARKKQWYNSHYIFSD